MSVLPRGERVRNAVRWISGRLGDDPSLNAIGLTEAAATRFDLTPKESEELLQFYRAAARLNAGDPP